MTRLPRASSAPPGHRGKTLKRLVQLSTPPAGVSVPGRHVVPRAVGSPQGRAEGLWLVKASGRCLMRIPRFGMKHWEPLMRGWDLHVALGSLPVLLGGGGSEELGSGASAQLPHTDPPGMCGSGNRLLSRKIRVLTGPRQRVKRTKRKTRK